LFGQVITKILIWVSICFCKMFLFNDRVFCGLFARVSWGVTYPLWIQPKLTAEVIVTLHCQIKKPHCFNPQKILGDDSKWLKWPSLLHGNWIIFFQCIQKWTNPYPLSKNSQKKLFASKSKSRKTWLLNFVVLLELFISQPLSFFKHKLMYNLNNKKVVFIMCFCVWQKRLDFFNWLFHATYN
jgi:hypothetical protein